MAAQWPAKILHHQDTGTRRKRRNICHSLSRRDSWGLEQRWASVRWGWHGGEGKGMQREGGHGEDSLPMKSLWGRGLVSDGLVWKRGTDCDEVEQHTEKKTLGAGNSHERDCCDGQEAMSQGWGGWEEAGLSAANVCKKIKQLYGIPGAAKFRFGSVLLWEWVDPQMDFVSTFLEISVCVSYERKLENKSNLEQLLEDSDLSRVIVAARVIVIVQQFITKILLGNFWPYLETA